MIFYKNVCVVPQFKHNDTQSKCPKLWTSRENQVDNESNSRTGFISKVLAFKHGTYCCSLVVF
jgi:hypothetical protein